MTAGMPSRALPVCERVLAEAAAWIVKLHGPDRTGTVELGWKDWFGAHPDHAAAWELVSDKWNRTHDIPVGLVHTPVRVRQRSRTRPMLLALTGAASLAVVWAVLFLGREAISTTVGEQRIVSLEDGTRIELNTATRLRVKYDRKTRAVELKSGEAYFSVAHERRPFVVVAGSRRIVALGTSFTVRRDQLADDAVTVTLIEGRLAVAPIDTGSAPSAASIPEPMVLKTGERLQTRGHASAILDTPSIDRVTGWLHGQLIFDHTPLGEAVHELNRYSPKRLSLASAQIGQVLVSGTFRVGDSLSFATAAAQTYGLKFATHGDDILLARHDESPAHGLPRSVP